MLLDLDRKHAYYYEDDNENMNEEHGKWLGMGKIMVIKCALGPSQKIWNKLLYAVWSVMQLKQSRKMSHWTNNRNRILKW